MSPSNLPSIRRYRKIALAVPALALAFLFGGGGSAALACPYSGAPPANLSAAQAEQSVVCLVNKARRHHKARPLTSDPGLQSAARAHSAAMDASDFFSHMGDGTPIDRVKASGYLGGASTWSVGENIHWGPGHQGSPKATVSRWMRSAMHRSTMLSRQFRNIGVGVAMGSPAGGSGANSAIYTANFGLSR
jgi:uncharacterized protein YkwD